MDSGVFCDTSDGRRQFLIDDDTANCLDSSRQKINASMVKIFIYSYLSLLSDSPLAKSKGPKPLRLYNLLLKQITSEGLKPFVTRMADIAHEWTSGLTLMGGGPITGYFLDCFKSTPIFKEYLEWYRSADPELMKYIYTFLVFGKKMWYVDEELNSIAFRDWEKVESKLSDLSLPEDVLPWLKECISGLISPPTDVPLFPKFGPGSVFEVGLKGAISKSNNLRYDARLDRAFFRSHFVNYGLQADLGYNPDKFYLGMKPKKEKLNHDESSTRATGSDESASRQLHAHSLHGRVHLPKGRRTRAEEGYDPDCSRLRFVPKTLKTARSICMENNTRMCFQQAYLRVLLAQMDNPTARRFINFEDQSRNRQLADYGSYTSEIDTIDLSAASDSVHVDLVRSCFPKRELYFLLATRSTHVDVGDLSPNRRRRVIKFAPMGSALCFPTQSLIFTGVIIAAAIKTVFGGHWPDKGEFLAKYANIGVFVERHFARSVGYIHPSLEFEFQPASVYGDDICVDRRLTQTVTSLLTSLGFTVNYGKSFVGSQAFRESCGGYYWQGYDVTPLYFRVPYHRRPGAEVYMSALSLANSAGDRRYFNLRKYLIHYLLDVYRFVRFTDKREDTDAVFSTSVRNSHLRRRYNTDYQRDEVQGMAVAVKEKRKPLRRERNAYESYLYLRWQASRISGIVPDDFLSSASRYDASGARLVGRWTPG